MYSEYWFVELFFSVVWIVFGVMLVLLKDLICFSLFGSLVSFLLVMNGVFVRLIFMIWWVFVLLLLVVMSVVWLVLVMMIWVVMCD